MEILCEEEEDMWNKKIEFAKNQPCNRLLKYLKKLKIFIYKNLIFY